MAIILVNKASGSHGDVQNNAGLYAGYGLFFAGVTVGLSNLACGFVILLTIDSHVHRLKINFRSSFLLLQCLRRCYWLGLRHLTRTRRQSVHQDPDC
jgi:hypothetical protein